LASSLAHLRLCLRSLVSVDEILCLLICVRKIIVLVFRSVSLPLCFVITQRDVFNEMDGRRRTLGLFFILYIGSWPEEGKIKQKVLRAFPPPRLGDDDPHRPYSNVPLLPRDAAEENFLLCFACLFLKGLLLPAMVGPAALPLLPSRFLLLMNQTSDHWANFKKKRILKDFVYVIFVV